MKFADYVALLPLLACLPHLEVVHAAGKSWGLSASEQRGADGYVHGRATWYDTVLAGSCGYFEKVPKFVGAWPDVQYAYGESCGMCLEVSCEPGWVESADKHISLDRSKVCQDPNKAIVLQIVDTCSCTGNTQWCCGDRNHIDLGLDAFKALAVDYNQGLMNIKWRPVRCDRAGEVVVKGSQPSVPTPKLNQNADRTIQAFQGCGGIHGCGQATCPDGPWDPVNKCHTMFHACTRRTAAFWACRGDGPNGNTRASWEAATYDGESQRPARTPKPSPPPPAAKTGPKVKPSPPPPSSGTGCQRYVPIYSQCGGLGGMTGPGTLADKPFACCRQGRCHRKNKWYWQCLPM